MTPTILFQVNQLNSTSQNEVKILTQKQTKTTQKIKSSQNKKI